MSGTHHLVSTASRKLRPTAEFETEATRDCHRWDQDDVGKVVRVKNPLKWWLIVSVQRHVATFQELSSEMVAATANEIAFESPTAGETVQSAIDTLARKISAATSASGIANDSSVEGATVSQAFDSLIGIIFGQVRSVFGRTGHVTAHAGDYSAAQVGAPPVARTISAGTGLTGGGDLSANRTLSVSFGSTAGSVCEGNDPRLSGGGAPSMHALNHLPGGSDALASGPASSLSAGGGNAEGSATAFARQDHLHALPPFGSAAGTFCQGNDARLSDARSPTSHALSHLPGGADGLASGPASSLSAGGSNAEGSATAFARQDHLHALPPFGSAAGTFCQGNDARLSDARSPTSHALSHLPGAPDGLASGPASSLSVGGSNAEGTAGAFARQDHQHGLPPFGSTSATFCEGNDARLSDARSPTSHALSHLPGAPDGLASGPASSLSVGGSNAEGTAGAFARQDHQHGLPPFGSTSATFCEGNDARLSDARSPTSHALTHLPGAPDGLAIGMPVAIGLANDAGSAAAYARADHVHDGSGLLACDGSRALSGALNLGGNNLTNVGAVFEQPIAFAWAGNAATIDVSVKNDFVASGTLTGNSTITLTNGSDGCQGTVYVKQDATGGRGLGFVVPGRTILREAGAMDSNPQQSPNTVTGYAYDFKTIGGTAYVIVERFFLT